MRREKKWNSEGNSDLPHDQLLLGILQLIVKLVILVGELNAYSFTGRNDIGTYSLSHGHCVSIVASPAHVIISLFFTLFIRILLRDTMYKYVCVKSDEH